MKLAKNLNCFTKYDVRGRLGEEFNENIAYRIGRATAQSLSAKTVVVGFDSRETSKNLSKAVSKGVCDSGAQVLDIGFVGTEQMYHAVSYFKASAGIEITASHNPIEYNGMKIVKQGSQPLADEEFADIKLIAELNNFESAETNKSIIDKKSEACEAYIEKILSFVDVENLDPLKIVINSGNGSAGPIIDKLTEKFYRVDNAGSRESRGTGLGLSIVNEIVQKYGASLKIESQPNIGSKFSIIFLSISPDV